MAGFDRYRPIRATNTYEIFDRVSAGLQHDWLVEIWELPLWLRVNSHELELVPPIVNQNQCTLQQSLEFMELTFAPTTRRHSIRVLKI